MTHDPTHRLEETTTYADPRPTYACIEPGCGWTDDATTGGHMTEIRTPEELDALPVGSVVRIGSGQVFARDDVSGSGCDWAALGSTLLWWAEGVLAEHDGPATLPYRPGAPTPPLQPEADRESLAEVLRDISGKHWPDAVSGMDDCDASDILCDGPEDCVTDIAAAALAWFAARQPAPTVSAEEVLGRHQRRSSGMTCACGTEVMPADSDDDPRTRRDNAFAAHQAAMLEVRDV